MSNNVKPKNNFTLKDLGEVKDTLEKIKDFGVPDTLINFVLPFDIKMDEIKTFVESCSNDKETCQQKIDDLLDDFDNSKSISEFINKLKNGKIRADPLVSILLKIIMENIDFFNNNAHLYNLLKDEFSYREQDKDKNQIKLDEEYEIDAIDGYIDSNISYLNPFRDLIKDSILELVNTLIQIQHGTYVRKNKSGKKLKKRSKRKQSKRSKRKQSKRSKRKQSKRSKRKQSKQSK